jgi:hypothetical protein
MNGRDVSCKRSMIKWRKELRVVRKTDFSRKTSAKHARTLREHREQLNGVVSWW